METIVCQSFESFMDMCGNKLVEGKNIHCTFNVSESSITYSIMKHEFDKVGGEDITISFTFTDKFTN